MTDRELLELAAKAAGYKKYYTHYLGRDSFVTYDEIYYSEVKERQVTEDKTMDWNPLTDDGDALRLAVDLLMSVEISKDEDFTYVYAGEVPRRYACEMWRDDKDAATRRAIVSAAAAIGESL